MKKQSFAQILLTGLQQSFQARPILALYLSNLVLSLIPTSIIVAGLSNNGRNPQILQRLNQQFLDALVDLGLSKQLSSEQSAWLIWLLLAFILQRVFFDFITGGVVATWDKRQSFLAASLRWFISNVVISVAIILSFYLIITLAGLLSANLNMLAGLIVGIILLLGLNNLGEYARIRGVATQQLNPFSQFFGALAFCLRHPATWLLSLLGLVCMIVPQILLSYTLGALNNAFLAIILQQVILIIISWSKVLRLSWAYHYFIQRSSANLALANTTNTIP